MNLEKYEKNTPGTLNHNTITRFIVGSNNTLTIKNKIM